AVLRPRRLRVARRQGGHRARSRHPRPGPCFRRSTGRSPAREALVAQKPGIDRPVGCTAMPYAFAFDHKHRKPPMSMKDLLGGKGANLAEMTSVLALPVPPGFTITTDACRAYMDGGWPAGLDDEVAKHVTQLEKAMGKQLGDPGDPLLV